MCMTSITAKITRNGEVTLPQEVRDELGIQGDTEVRFEVDGGEVRVYRNQPFDFSSLIGMGKLGPEWDGMSATEIVDELRGTPEERASLRNAPAHPNVTVLGKK